jgi:glyoxalase family protein
MRAPIPGIHHVTAIASDPQANLDFYTQVLGLRLVKLTVNFDDPTTYHLYFGNRQGTPGSILTFFPWPGIGRGTAGNGQVSATGFAVRPEALEFWRSHLAARRVTVEEAGTRFGDTVLRFGDPDGMPLELVGTHAANPDEGWTNGAIPAACAIGGFHSATLAEEGYERTASLLQSMGMQLIGDEDNRFRYAAASSGTGAIVDIVCSPGLRPGRLGAGTVHHIAWRTPNDSEQQSWRETLVESGYNVSRIMDRAYFRSIYFREPGGVLFEIATDPPGFATDESADHIGEQLMLPPFLASRRSEIEKSLPPLKLSPTERMEGAPRDGR